jgi:hypothetical protein
MSSSDIEIDEAELPQNKFSHRGKRAIEQITANATEHRLTSKKVYKQLSYGTGSVLQRGTQWSWINQFNAARTGPVFNQRYFTTRLDTAYHLLN